MINYTTSSMKQSHLEKVIVVQPLNKFRLSWKPIVLSNINNSPLNPVLAVYCLLRTTDGFSGYSNIQCDYVSICGSASPFLDLGRFFSFLIILHSR
jgi:hypothetical protein